MFRGVAATHQVKPVLEKLRRTLLGAGVLLLTSSVLLVGLIQTGTEDGVYGECRAGTGERCEWAAYHPRHQHGKQSGSDK